MKQKLQSIFEHTYEELIDDASYLASTKMSRERNLPSPDWFNDVVWEVILTFFIGLLSGLTANRLTNNKKLKQCQHKLYKLRLLKEKLSSELEQEKARSETLNYALDILKTSKLEKETLEAVLKGVNEISEVLEQNGWPKDNATIRSNNIFKIILKRIYDYTGI